MPFLLLFSLASATLPDTLPGWRTTGEAFEVALDSAVRRGGSSSGRIRSTATTAAFANVLQSVQARDYAGKRIRLTGWVRTAGLKGSVQMWARVDGSTGSFLDNMDDRPVNADTDWKQLTIVMDVADSAIGISFGLLLQGHGTVWIDDVQLEVVGNDVKTTGDLHDDGVPGADQVAMMKTRYATRPTAPLNPGFEK